MAGFVLFCITLTVGVIIPLFVEDFPGVYRNAWLMGLPMFALGMFLREYQDALCTRLGLTRAKLVLVVIFGTVLTMQQWFRFSYGFPFGTLLAAPALLLLLAEHPQIAAPGCFWEKVAIKCGACSTWIYLFHMIVYEVYGAFIQERLSLSLTQLEGWMRPILVFAVSAALAAFVDGMTQLIKKRNNGRITA